MTVLAAKAETYNSPCFDASVVNIATASKCLIGAQQSARPDFIVWGDSHADAILPAISTQASSRGRSGLVVVTHDCQPFADDLSANDACSESNSAALNLLTDPSLKLIFLVGNWAETRPTADKYIARLKHGVDGLIAMGKTVVLAADVPNQLYPVPDQLAMHSLWGTPLGRPMTRSAYEQQQSFLLDAVRKWVGPRFEVISPESILCESDICPIEEGGHPLYRDSSHLSRFGAAIVSPIFMPVFSSPQKSSALEDQ